MAMPEGEVRNLSLAADPTWPPKELLDLYRLAQDVRKDHHSALWEIEKHFTWWASTGFKPVLNGPGSTFQLAGGLRARRYSAGRGRSSCLQRQSVGVARRARRRSSSVAATSGSVSR